MTRTSGLLAVTILATVVVTGLDYVFKSAVAEHVPRERLGPFLARYHTAVNASALVFQLLVAPRILQGVGVIGALVLLPSLVAAGAAAFAVTGGLAAVLVAKGADGTMRHSLDRAGHEILHLPLPAAVRERWKAVTTGVGQRGGQALASLALLAASALGAGQATIAVGLAGLSVLWVATLLALRPHYVGRFREQLRSFRFGNQGSLPPLDVPALEILVASLGSADDAEALAALDVLESYEKQHLVSPLMVHHPSPPVALRALELLAASGRDDLPRLVDRALGHPDPDVRAAVLRVRTQQRPDEQLLRRHLTDPSPAVRCVALAGLAGAGLVDDAEAERVLHELLGSLGVDACPMLARALVNLPPSLGQPLARELRRHPDPRFGVALARALTAEPNVLFCETLVELLAVREARTHARMALVALGSVALERLGAALNDARTPDAIRLHVPRSIGRFADARAAALLVARLPREADSRVRYKILRALGRLRADDPTLPLDEDALRRAADVLLARAALLLTYRVAWTLLERDGTPRPPRPRLLPDLLADKERRAIEAVFRVLHVLEPGVGYDVAYRGLAAGDPRARPGGREILENVLPGRLRDAVLGLVEDGDPAARLATVLSMHEPPDARARSSSWPTAATRARAPPSSAASPRGSRPIRTHSSGRSPAGSSARTTRRTRRRDGPMPADAPHAVELLVALKTVASFAALPPEDLALLVERATLRRFALDTPVATPGTPVAAAHLVLEGALVEERAGRRWAVREAYELVGAADAVAGDDTRLGLRAAGVTRTLELDRARLLEVSTDRFDVLTTVAADVATMAIAARRRLGACGFRPAAAALPGLAAGAPHLAERLALLRGIPALADVPTLTLAGIAAATGEVAFDGGQTIWRAGEAAEEMLLVLSGAVACATEDGTHFVVGPGEAAGALDALAGRPRWYDATAAGRLVALRARVADVLDVLEDDPDAAIAALVRFARATVALTLAAASALPDGSAPSVILTEAP